MLKLLVVGSPKAGKTTVIRRLTGIRTTLEGRIASVTVTNGTHPLNLYYWDVDSHTNIAFAPIVSDSASGVIMVIDRTTINWSLGWAYSMFVDLQERRGKSLDTFIVLNKNDEDPLTDHELEVWKQWGLGEYHLSSDPRLSEDLIDWAYRVDSKAQYHVPFSMEYAPRRGKKCKCMWF